MVVVWVFKSTAKAAKASRTEIKWYRNPCFMPRGKQIQMTLRGPVCKPWTGRWFCTAVHSPRRLSTQTEEFRLG